MYVTLEPCTHFGITPPCTKIIKRKKIKNVYYSFNDPDSRTFKKAVKTLKNIKKIKKIDIKYKNFYKSYFLNKIKNFPLIDAKIAVSKDFFSINKKDKWITNLRSRQVAHLIRSKYDCIVSTSYTINKDNSLLNCRIDGLNNNKPDLVIIDRFLKLKKKLRLFNSSIRRKIYIFTLSNNKKKISFLKKKKIKIIKIKRLQDKIDFENLFKLIMKIGKGRVLVECGLIFLNQLFKYKLINNLYLFKSNKFLYSNGYNNQSINFIKKIKTKNKLKVNLDNDELFEIKIK